MVLRRAHVRFPCEEACAATRCATLSSLQAGIDRAGARVRTQSPIPRTIRRWGGRSEACGSPQSMNDIVQKLWGFCHTLRHDGIDYGDYIEQITYLLFLKMANERGINLSSVKPVGKALKKSVDCSWPFLEKQTDARLIVSYAEILNALGRADGILGDIYSGAQSKFSNSANLRKLVNLINDLQWTSLDIDVKAQAYEGLLEKAAAEGKKGAGQYFTPRVVIQSIVRCVKPDPRGAKDFAICDPAVGSGGFLVCAYEWLLHEVGGTFDRRIAKRISGETYFGAELVARPRRMALMNLYLHGIEPHIRLGDSIEDTPTSRRFDVILTNPPFGSKGAGEAPKQRGFAVLTSNKQLNFLQHILATLKPDGRAAVVLPDSALFAEQAGEVMRLLADEANLHTVLRLPRGTFTPYSHGVKANVIFFRKGMKTEKTWIYDARTSVPGITKNSRPLSKAHFAEFEKCYGSDPNGDSRRKQGTSKSDRWREFSIAEVQEKDFKLDGFRWLKEEIDDDDEPPTPEDLAAEAIAELGEAVAALGRVLAILEPNGNGDTVQ
jgi:type I restriction enzyme M protein